MLLLLVAFYARVSTEEQAERGSIENQVDFARRYFDLYLPDAQVDYYLDDGVSGTVLMADRLEGGRLLDNLEIKKYDALYSYRLDRLARSVKIVLDIYDLLESKNTALRSMTEAFDTSTPTGKFFMTLLASIAALERDTILERTQMGKERAAKQGRWTSGPPPFGYRIGEDRRLVIYEEEAETVRLIFDLYNEGMRTVPIAEYLNARDIPTATTSKGTRNKSIGKWQAGHVSIIIRNTAYMGEYHTMRRSKKGKKGITIKTPAIVNREEFDQANKLLLKNADVARGAKGRTYLLRGLIFCGKCGHAMVGNSRGDRQYYRCSMRNDLGNGIRCESKQIKAEPLEQAIWRDIVRFIKNPGEVIEMLQSKVSQVAGNEGPALQELGQVEAAILEKKAARSRVISMVSKGIASEADAEEELTAIKRDMDVLGRRRDDLFAIIQRVQEQRNTATNIAVALEKYRNVIDRIDPVPEMVKLLVDRIEIFDGEQDGKRHSRANVRYRFTPSNCGLELCVSGDAQV